VQTGSELSRCWDRGMTMNERGEVAQTEKTSRGRRSKAESRANEFRQRLLHWENQPESFRPSLRSLASELNTSHQLLRHYLSGLSRWRAGEQWKVAKEIRAQARSEGRLLTPVEEEQARRLDRSALRIFIEGFFEGM